MALAIQDKATILFQGDSITDAGRSRTDDAQLGGGYANCIATCCKTLFPDKGLRFINRGISGNRAKDLRARWQADCLDLKPDWVSIMIGINDTWRHYDSNDPTPADAYERDYHFILTQVKETLGARLILLEPFVLPVPADRKKWREDLDPKIAAARRLAVEFQAIYVPLDGIFAAAACQRPAAEWAGDGVHPSAAGHALIARAWLEAVGAI
ncbi:MAG: GDSL family lipase [Lentisphaerae bacterium RIFOXYB12_FULL_65_16]|nr:MAG: GDSL family lipase [Lentisphaerae bacterium RIFOXYA12_64_32]OGV84235.1 MAG: GDSL family lipase [Lentisphaerae bacterium RIFOXYB12_FULL_65_16]